jgi:predicted acyl esterase
MRLTYAYESTTNAWRKLPDWPVEEFEYTGSFDSALAFASRKQISAQDDNYV